MHRDDLVVDGLVRQRRRHGAREVAQHDAAENDRTNSDRKLFHRFSRVSAARGMCSTNKRDTSLYVETAAVRNCQRLATHDGHHRDQRVQRNLPLAGRTNQLREA